MKTLFASILVLFLMIGSFQSLAAAQTHRQAGTEVTIDLKDLDDYTRNQILNKMKEKESGSSGKSIMESLPKVDPNSAREWAKVVTETIKDICHNLNVEVNDFIKTPVGMIVAGTIVYKVIGKDVLVGLKDTIFGVIGWAITMLILFFVARRFVIPRKVKTVSEWEDKEGKKITETSYRFVEPYDFNSDDARIASVVILSLIAAASTIAAMVIVL